MICTVDKKKGTSVIIDDMEWHGVKFISISQSWLSGLQFPIAHFPGLKKSIVASSSSQSIKAIGDDDEL